MATMPLGEEKSTEATAEEQAKGDNKPQLLSKRAKRAIGTVTTLLVVALLVCFCVLFYATTALNGDNRQAELNAAYVDAANKLRDCKNQVAFAAQSTFPDDLGADKVLTQAVAGAYNTGKVIQRDGLLKALNIPITKPISTEAFATVLLLAQCQDNYLGAQTTLDGKLNAFKDWMANDWFANHTSPRSFPDGGLQVALPDRCVRGAEALALMERPVAEMAMATNWDVKSPLHDSCNKK